MQEGISTASFLLNLCSYLCFNSWVKQQFMIQLQSQHVNLIEPDDSRSGVLLLTALLLPHLKSTQIYTDVRPQIADRVDFQIENTTNERRLLHQYTNPAARTPVYVTETCACTSFCRIQKCQHRIILSELSKHWNILCQTYTTFVFSSTLYNCLSLLTSMIPCAVYWHCLWCAKALRLVQWEPACFPSTSAHVSCHFISWHRYFAVNVKFRLHNFHTRQISVQWWASQVAYVTKRSLIVFGDCQFNDRSGLVSWLQDLVLKVV